MALAANISAGSISKSSSSGDSKRTSDQRRQDGEIVDFANRTKRIAAGGGNAEVIVSKNRLILATDANTAIGMSDGCIILDGKIHFSHRPDDICINGFWRFNQALLTEIPSTLAFPVETLIFKYPNSMKRSSKVISLISGLA